MYENSSNGQVGGSLSDDSNQIDDIGHASFGINRLSQPINFEEFLTNRSALFEIDRDQNSSNLLNLDNYEEEEMMKKKIVESQLRWNESQSAGVGILNADENLHHLDFDALALSMTDVKLPDEFLSLSSVPGGLKHRVIKRGSGDNAKKGDLVWVHYRMFIEHSDEPIDDTFAQESAKRFTVGNEEVIAALDYSVLNMNAGQTDQVLATHHYAFGPMGCEPRIPRESRVLLYMTLIRIHSADTEVPIEDLGSDERRLLGFDVILKAAEKRKLIGNDLFKRDDFQGAVKEYLKCQELANELIAKTEKETFEMHNILYVVHVNLAMSYLALDKFRKAVLHCNGALAVPLKDSMKTKAYYRLAKAQFEMGEMEGAEKNIKRAYELNSNDPDIKTLHGEITKGKAKEWRQEREMAQKMFGKLNMN